MHEAYHQPVKDLRVDLVIDWLPRVGAHQLMLSALRPCKKVQGDQRDSEERPG